jgi:hypothetical protein
MSDAAAAREALRQQIMLRALWLDARPGVLAGWCRDGDRFARGLAAYRANAGALAERALAAAYPTLQQLVGDESFAALARAFWHRHPPERGDITTWGGELAGFVAAAQSLAEEPYLADVARLEWALHTAAGAADSSAAPPGLERLADADPATLRLLARPGTALVESAHPIVAIWQAHRAEAGAGDDRFAAVRQAFAESRADAALVWRAGWRVEVAALPPPDAQFTAAVLGGQPLGAALHAVQERSPSFDFTAWLLAALQRGWLAGATTTTTAP